MLVNGVCSHKPDVETLQISNPDPTSFAEERNGFDLEDFLLGKLSGLPGGPLQPLQSSGLTADGPGMIPLYTHTLHMCL